ncbi:YhjD/YihY/BrkB family envelope integrity protein [Streptomyces sp. NRRL WC-3742]|uniref:YhjD/YihY/BrkB family envelope integrity protein n=1 Tax=Streptomyces sp. NRRL WC-3742 TaxID=1463934 RepID=UPI00068E0307|nr:YhjD/YihY/BrkB family envelope integrity protein [Streptomyces sp. NRRL WC-3742]
MPAKHGDHRTGSSRWRRVRALPREVWQGGREVELLQHAMAFAALFFVTLVPLLVVLAAAIPSRGSGIADWINDGLALSGRSAKAVSQLFASRSEVLSTTTALSLAALAVFGISLMSAVQRMYEKIWHLPSGPWHSVWRQVLGLAGLIALILVTTWHGLLPDHAAAISALRAAGGVLGGLLYFWWLQRLLLGSRIAWSALLPGAVATVAALAGLRVFSRFVFAPLVVSNAVSYGAVGTVLVVQSWLIGVGYTVYAGALVGQVCRRGRAHDARPVDPR